MIQQGAFETVVLFSRPKRLLQLNQLHPNHQALDPGGWEHLL